MDFLSAFADVRGVAIVLQPEIFNLMISKGFEDATVELVAGSIGRRWIG